MTPELQKQLAELLAKLMDVASDATKWAGSQIPPLVQEKIMLGRVVESAWMLAAAVFAFVIIRASVRFWPRALQLTKDGDDPVVVVPVLGVGLGFVVLMIRLEAFALVWFAPRLYIVEWLKSMVK